MRFAIHVFRRGFFVREKVENFLKKFGDRNIDDFFFQIHKNAIQIKNKVGIFNDDTFNISLVQYKI